MTDWKQLLSDIALRVSESKYPATAELSQYGLYIRMNYGKFSNSWICPWDEVELAKAPLISHAIKQLEEQLERASEENVA